MKKIWKGFNNFAKVIGRFQMNVLLSLIYIVILVPMSIIAKIFFAKQFAKNNNTKDRKSLWLKKPKQKYDLKWARKM
jgi:hypothetical protein